MINSSKKHLETLKWQKAFCITIYHQKSRKWLTETHCTLKKIASSMRNCKKDFPTCFSAQTYPEEQAILIFCLNIKAIPINSRLSTSKIYGRNLEYKDKERKC